MGPLTPYLIFNGNCKQALDFYKTILGGELFIHTYGEAKQLNDLRKEDENKIMHGNLKKGNFLLMASDTHGPDIKMGDNVQLSIECESREEVDRLFKGLSEKGKPTLSPNETFWGAYFGMMTDQFGINWMLNFELPKK